MAGFISLIATAIFILCFSYIVFSEQEGQLRLVDGTSSNNGRLEIFHDGQWGTICDDGFERQDAIVACRELGMPYTNVRALSWSYYGRGTGPIHLSDVGCLGTEARLTDCIANSWDTRDCRHHEDVGIMCDPSTISNSVVPVQDAIVEEGQLRLINGNTDFNGRLEIYYNGRWATICDDRFKSENAMVVCRQLGLPLDNVRVYKNGIFGRGSASIHLDKVFCDGMEARLADCWFRSLDSCYHVKDVGVGCYPGTK